MNEVRLEIYVDGNGNCTMHSGAASNVDIINTLVNVLATACDVVATDKEALLADVCAGLMDPPEYTCEDYSEQEG